MKRYMALLADMESAGYLSEEPEGDWVRYEEAHATEARLAEATGLLDEGLHVTMSSNQIVNWVDRIKAFLSRAPAQPAAPVLKCAEHDAPLANEAFFKCGCRYFPQPAAPEPGAETIAFWRHFRDEASFPSTIRKGKEWQARGSSAEAQLAAVREIGHDQRLTPHQRWERIMALLSPPSPSAVPGDDERAACTVCGKPCLYGDRHPKCASAVPGEKP